MYEALGRFEDAVIDYQAVLKALPKDPSGWNNLGNVKMDQVRVSSGFTKMVKTAQRRDC